MANRSEAFDGADSGPRPGDFACAGDDLKDMLASLSRQFFEADQRNASTLQEMRGRLEMLGRATESVRDQVPPQYAPAFARIEDGVHLLAEQIAAIGREREIARATAALTSAFDAPTGPAAPATIHAAAHAGAAASAFVAPEPAPVLPVVAAVPAVAPVADVSVAGNAAEPWDRQSAEALADLYESGSASLADKALPEPAAPKAIVAAAAPAHAHTFAAVPAAVIDTADRAWLEARFADIAGKVEQSLAGMRPEHTLAAFDSRIGELEQRLGAAFEDVATRADVEGLRIVEAHINELANQFDQARTHLERLDNIERQVGDLMHQVSDERFTQLFGQIAQPAAAQGPSEEDIEAVAMAVADRVASRLPGPSVAVAAAPSVDGATIADLKRVVEGFVSGQRESEEHTATMLDTMQQAMIRMLDRMDALESAAPAYGSHGAAFASAPAAASAPASVPAEPAIAPGNRAEPSFAAAPPAKEDFRAAAIADARRAARKVASQGETGDAPAAVAAGSGARARRGAPAAEAAGTAAAEAVAEKKPRSKLPMMVAGIALIAAVGVLAATVGFKGSTPGASVQQAQRKAPLTIDNGSVEPSSDTLPAAPGKNDGTAPSPEQNAQPSAPPARAGDGGATNRPRTQSALEGDKQTEMVVVPQHASAAASRAPVAPVGVALTQTNTPPADSDLARMRRERNMASLASQLAAVQANAPALPASMTQTIAVETPAEAAPAEVAGGPALAVTIGPNSLRVAAQKGDPSAEFEVAARFAEGRGVGQDFKQASFWYGRAAQRGFAPAQYRLGTLFERGIGAKADVARAKIWYGRAAEQGHVKAMHNLAVLNAGNGEGSDYAAAVHWFTSAAERGLADSQYNLGVLYESGLGMNRDMKQAYQWLSLAARTGDKEAARRRDQIRMKLEEVDAAAIDRIVGNWQPKAVDGSINEARAAGEVWKQRQAAR